MEEYRLALRNLELHYQDFLRDSQDSEMFGAEDRMQVESNYNKANQHYNTLVSSAEQGVYFLINVTVGTFIITKTWSKHFI